MPLLSLLLAATAVVVPADSLVPLSVRFSGMVGAAPFQCGQSYADIGVSKASITASDFRFYVHNVRLVTAKGDTVRASLAPLAPWQDADVALVDFENGQATCANGTPELHPEVTVLAPKGDYKGVAFTLGVPFTRNHGDLSAQPAPLSLSHLFWSWNSGYKFMRVDMRATQGDSTATAWVIHLGSTGCTGATGAASSPGACAQPNRAEVRLPGFDPSKDVVVADLAAILSRVDVRKNQPKTAAGCMSAPSDSDCGGLFASLGLPHPNSTGADTPAFFRAMKASAVRAANSNGSAPR